MRRALMRAAFLACALAVRAGLSFASVYRRFSDKDGLMREVFTRVAEMNYEMGQEKTGSAPWKGQSLASVVSALIAAQATGDRRHDSVSVGRSRSSS